MGNPRGIMLRSLKAVSAKVFPLFEITLVFLMHFVLQGIRRAADDEPFSTLYALFGSAVGVGVMAIAVMLLIRSIREAIWAEGEAIWRRLLLAAVTLVVTFATLLGMGQVVWPGALTRQPMGDLGPWGLLRYSIVVFFNLGEGCCPIEPPSVEWLQPVVLVEAVAGVAFLVSSAAIGISRLTMYYDAGRMGPTANTAANPVHPADQAQVAEADEEYLPPTPTGPSDKNDLELYKIAVDTRKLELTLFWQRSLFFWGFLAAIVAGYVLAQQQLWIRLVLSQLGFLASSCWWLVNKGSKYWHENWELMVRALEAKPTGLFTQTTPVQRKGLLGAAEYSVSKITIFFSGCTALLFLGLSGFQLISHYRGRLPVSWFEIGLSWWPALLTVGSISGVVYVAVRGRSSSAGKRVLPRQGTGQ